MPSGPLRRTLRAAGHHLSPIVQVGKEGATEAVARQLEQALYDHELVKVKVGAESPEDRFEAADRLAAAAGGQLAQILGRTLLVYKRHPEAPRFEPRAPAEVEAPAERAPPRPPRRAVPLRDGFRREAGARKARRDAPDVSGARGDAPRRKGPRADGPARKGTRAGGAGWKGARGEGAARKSGRAGGAAWKGTRAEGAGWKGTRAEGAVRKGGRAGGAARKGTRG
ncbi:MAG: YhbY family RNA-binding protein, partial [Anaeromyxobacteraceae bacterium]